MPKRSKVLCGVCSEGSPDKMANFYWAWTWPTGDRRSYLQWLDAECAASRLNALYKADNEGECMVCQERIDPDDYQILWVTYYIPGKEREDYSFDFHPNCFAQVSDAFALNARRLPDRGSERGGPPSQTKGNPWDSWDQQGIHRRVEAS